MARYRQLTLEQRYQIQQMRIEGKTQAAMALALGVNRSTICRELARNTGRDGYRPHEAQRWTDELHRKPRRPRKLVGPLRQLVRRKLKLDWSPEQISGWLERMKRPTVSHETIYRFVWADKFEGGKLHEHLRQSSKLRRKRYGSNKRRGAIPGRVGIEERPAIVEQRRRLGDWEVDSVLGRQESQAVLSAAERKSRFTLLRKVATRRADVVATALTRMLAPYRNIVRTVTSDNGREFAEHARVSRALRAGFYFARPYCSCDRGLNENTNGLVRQYLPKRASLDDVCARTLQFIMRRLNNRPRKCLGYKTPKEVIAAAVT